MIADVKLALQKDGFILLLSIRPSMRIQPIQMLTFCIKVLREVFFFLLLIFLKAFYLGC